MKKRLRYASLAAFLLVSSLYADLGLPAVFSDNMVLQRKKPITVWGWASPGEKVVVRLANTSASAITDSTGEWVTQLKPLQAGGPHELKVKGETETELFTNVMIGEVWVCSGQSNMTMALEKAKNAEKEIADANYPKIRLFSVPRRVSRSPREDCDGRWQVCTPDIARGFSAVGYFFGRDLHETLDVPVGLIHASWPGTRIDAWMSWERIETDTMFTPILDRYRKEVAEYPGKKAEFLKAWNEYMADTTAKRAFQYDPGNRGAEKGYARPDFEPEKWETIELPTFIEKPMGKKIDGAVWFRKKIAIPENWVGHDLEIRLGTIDDFDVTYCNGVKVGETGVEIPEPYMIPRHYVAPGSLVTSSEVTLAVRVFDHFGGGGFAGPPEAMELSCPARNSHVPLRGDWRFHMEIPLEPSAIGGPGTPGVPRQPRDPNSSNRPSGLYNGMITPVAPYTLSGTIWYQGEANASTAYQYRRLLPAMIADWRETWNDTTMPFGIVQLVNFRDRDTVPSPSTWAELREAQAMAARSDPHVGLAVGIDVGQANRLHPANKRPLGERLSAWAQATVYGRNLVYSGPALKRASFGTDTVTLVFEHIGSGLAVKGDSLTGFSLAGSDSVFHWATARIQGDSVMVWSDLVETPVELRYGWANNPDCNLYNKEGFPAVPFRTDSFPGVTFSER